jgi:protein arginine kinase
MKISELAWLSGHGPHADVVLSSRLRLARNLNGYPFPSLGHAPSLSEVAGHLADVLERQEHLRVLDLLRLDSLEAHVMVEQHLISPAFAASNHPRVVAFSPDASISVMVNEEDHLRLQCLMPGLQLELAFEAARRLEEGISDRLSFAFDQQFGYLTSCPSNVGTGLRASAMLHLPALAWVHALDAILSQVSRLGLAVRGVFGEGTRSVGHLVQVSNQVTLGPKEEEILSKIRAVCEQLVQYEGSAREQMLHAQRAQVEDKVWRSFGLLRSARLVDSLEAMEHLSFVRLGSSLGLLPKVPVAVLNSLLVRARPANLQTMAGRELEPIERDSLRAKLVRETLLGLDSKQGEPDPKGRSEPESPK